MAGSQHGHRTDQQQTRNRRSRRTRNTRSAPAGGRSSGPVISQATRARGGNSPGSPVSTVAARRPITVRDLLTQSSGVSYGGNPATKALYQAWIKAGEPAGG